MDHGIYVATSGFLTQQKRLEAIANNLANSTTSGYKGEVPVFRVLTSPQAGPRSTWARPVWNPVFASLEAYGTDFSRGPLKKTENPLDVALAGDGFFEIETPEGPRYSRKGEFTLDEAGTLTTQDGHPVMGWGGRIVLTAGDVQIDQEGNVFVDGIQENRLRVVTFAQKDQLVKEENGRFAWHGEPGDIIEAEMPEVRQGFVEMSNVNPVREMVNMIETIRTYEAQQKVIHAFDNVERKAVDEVGRVR